MLTYPCYIPLYINPFINEQLLHITTNLFIYLSSSQSALGSTAASWKTNVSDVLPVVGMSGSLCTWHPTLQAYVQCPLKHSLRLLEILVRSSQKNVWVISIFERYCRFLFRVLNLRTLFYFRILGFSTLSVSWVASYSKCFNLTSTFTSVRRVGDIVSCETCNIACEKVSSNTHIHISISELTCTPTCI